MTCNPTKLKEILRLHDLWLKGEKGGERADLTGVGLHGVDLTGVNLSRANLTGVDLTKAILIGAKLVDANLFNAALIGADLYRASLHRANLINANLNGANLTNAGLNHAILHYADLQRANLTGANLYSATLLGANLRGANLIGATLYRAVGDDTYIRTLQTDHWPIAYTSDVIQIGCQCHEIEAWWNFTDEQIAEMDRSALEWWKRWKPTLQNIVTELAPANPTK